MSWENLCTLLNYHIEVNDYPSVKQFIKTHQHHLEQLTFILNMTEPGRFGPPLWLSISRGCHSISKLLIQWGADVNWQSPSTYITCLHIACENLDVEAVQLLCSYGANPQLTLLHVPNTPYELAQQMTVALLAKHMTDFKLFNTQQYQHQLIDRLFTIKTLLFPNEQQDDQSENQP